MLLPANVAMFYRVPHHTQKPCLLTVCKSVSASHSGLFFLHCSFFWGSPRFSVEMGSRGRSSAAPAVTESRISTERPKVPEGSRGAVGLGWRQGCSAGCQTIVCCLVFNYFYIYEEKLPSHSSLSATVRIHLHTELRAQTRREHHHQDANLNKLCKTPGDSEATGPFWALLFLLYNQAVQQLAEQRPGFTRTLGEGDEPADTNKQLNTIKSYRGHDRCRFPF
ncbi:uncharacterized protein LOC110396664 isoform X2 [Numida meleagris]|uniref:uncharacterized protein LOC110396664 isoform X2 n=1 Tax=Numida meleagris TaxID=8996 RepID=UPI000B3E0642|nr:uncharacterized protein LOC110396664 isoform X2 [Numida meleagris]